MNWKGETDFFKFKNKFAKRYENQQTYKVYQTDKVKSVSKNAYKRKYKLMTMITGYTVIKW